MGIPKRQRLVRSFPVIVVMMTLAVAVTWAARPMRVSKLPEAVQQSLQEMFPDARIHEVEYQRKIVRLYEIEVIDDGEENTLIVSRDGTVMSVEHEISPNELPAEALIAIQKLSGSTRIEEAERIQVLRELGTLTLEDPRIEYEATFVKNGKEHDVVVSEDGTILKTPKQLRLEESM